MSLKNMQSAVRAVQSRKRHARIRNYALLLVLLFETVLAAASPADLAFKTAGDGLFSFNTGVVKGRLRADKASQGIYTLTDLKTGMEIAHGAGNPGILSYYRLLSTGERWAEAFRSWPKSAKRLADGSVEVSWPARPDHPVKLKATYRWKSPDTLDLETIIRPERDMSRVEVFLSSYFSKNFRTWVYVRAPRHAPGKPSFLPLDVTPFTIGTYLAFPRDLRSAQTIYDGRWERGPNPVQFSVNRFLEAPLALKRDSRNDITFVLMSRPQDCFAIEAAYDRQPADGVAGHHSVYLSLFGFDLKSGQTARALTRMVVGRNITDTRAIGLYRAFIAGEK